MGNHLSVKRLRRSSSPATLAQTAPGPPEVPETRHDIRQIPERLDYLDARLGCVVERLDRMGELMELLCELIYRTQGIPLQRGEEAGWVMEGPDAQSDFSEMESLPSPLMKPDFQP